MTYEPKDTVAAGEWIFDREAVTRIGVKNLRHLRAVSPIEVGSTVWAGGGSVHWVVESIESRIEPLGVVLRSGLTGRIRRETFSNLTPFTSKEQS